MAEPVLYRKYRPQEFEEVLGQEHVVSVLQGAVAQGNIAHAYLFAGSRGTGKTTMARIFAKSIGVTPKDLYEIDAASNRGIDDVRELRDAVSTLPFESPYKAYIIDEAHMLTKEAFNAFLKTLEEPPQHAIFILATTELEKLPETITSRCQTFTFKKPSQRILREMIVRVAKKEGYVADSPAAELIAFLADGSFRDAHGVLQKIILSTKEKRIGVEDVEVVTGAPPNTLVNSCIEALAAQDIEAALKAVRQSIDQGVDMTLFVKLLLNKIRAILLLRFSKEIINSISEQFTEEDFVLLKAISENKKSNINAHTLKTLLEASTQIGSAYVPQLPLELALMDILGTSG